MSSAISMISTSALALALALSAGKAKAASFDCTAYEEFNAAERRVCDSPVLGALDERLDSWYRRALHRASFFDQVAEVRQAQRHWIAERNSCGSRFWCLRRVYLKRIHQLREYVEHV